MAYPADFKYTKEHEWLKVDGNTGTIGITDHAQNSLGDIVFVELPKVGAWPSEMKMSPFGALRRNRGSRKPLAYNSILNPGGTLGCALAGRSTTRARLIARAFELGGGKS